MRRSARLRRHFSYANCCATLALFIAVSTGGAFAASQIDGRTIKRNSIPASALQNNSVTSAKVKNGQIMAADVKSGAITGPKIASGTIPLGAISKSAQQALGGVGQNVSTPTGNGETAITKTQDGKTWEYALIDIVPKGAGLPCRVMNQTYPNGVWELSGAAWVCKVTMGDGQIALTQPATKGSPNTSGSGAVNA